MILAISLSIIIAFYWQCLLDNALSCLELAPALLSSRPTLGQLQSMWSPSQRIAIIRNVAPWWKWVARCLKFSSYFLNEIESSRKEDDESCCELMFQRWLEGVGVQPATWASLLKALDETRVFSSLVNEVKQFLAIQLRCRLSKCIHIHTIFPLMVFTS